MDLAARYAQFALDLTFERLPGDVVSDVKKLILDQLGVMLVGSSAAGVDSLLSAARAWGGARQGRVLVHGDHLPAPQAALINGTMARAQDYDAVHEDAIVHITAGSLPACLAAAEQQGAVSGRDLITAMAAAMELMIRLGLSFETNFLKTGRVTTLHQSAFGGALGAAKLMGLDERQIVSALGLAYGQVAGNLQVTVEGTVLVRVLQGVAAQVSVQSAVLAEAGLVGPERVFQGEWGYFKAYHDNRIRTGVLTDGLGEDWKIPGISIKYYPCCFLAHFGIEAARDLVVAHKLKPDDIERIDVRMTQGSYNVVGAPVEAKRKPASVQEALFSVPYTVAAAATAGELTLRQMTAEAIADPGVQALAQRVHPCVDAGLEKAHSLGIGPTIVDIATRSGAVLSKRVDLVKGHPNDPMSFDDCVGKFMSCVPFAARPIPPAKIDELIERVRHLERADDVGAVVSLLS